MGIGDQFPRRRLSYRNSMKYFSIVAKIRGVFVTRGDADEDEVGGLDRVAISPYMHTYMHDLFTSFPYLLYTIFRSSNDSPLPDIFSTMFFLRYCG